MLICQRKLTIPAMVPEESPEVLSFDFFLPGKNYHWLCRILQVIDPLYIYILSFGLISSIWAPSALEVKL